MKFKIKKASHYSSVLLGIPHAILLHFGNKLAYNVKFTDSCKYITVDPLNQTDVNKLFGMTTGLTSVHKDSARFGWRYMPATGKIMLHAYVYSKGIARNFDIEEVDINWSIDLEIVRTANAYFFHINNKIAKTVIDDVSTEKSVNFQCFPYFGGTEAAPHDIELEMTRIW